MIGDPNLTSGRLGRKTAWSSHKSIPIRNLWVLLAYASGLARFLDPFSTEIEDDTELPEVLARLLVHVVERKLRRSLSRGYQPNAATLSRVRGRINWFETETRLLLSRGQISCRYEELTHDIPRNRLALAALTSLTGKLENVDLIRQCNCLARHFRDAGVINKRPSCAELSGDKGSRSDSDDNLMLRVATIALDLVLPSETAGTEKHHGLDHNEMLLRRIFEQAIAGFYRHELHGKFGWSVKGQTHLNWAISEQSEGLKSILPSMRADMMFEQAGIRRIILDTKFTNIMSPRSYGSEGIKSAHLYQIYSYLRSQVSRGDDLADTAEGILLHPAVNRHLDENVTIQGHRLRFVTVDLAAKPIDLRNQLLDIICQQS
ncbi:protein McrC [Brucella sp. NBRC 12953]|uniref:5-methylcytosine-specific restriction endonuclease system specificity protein McrC n=1 Tax=Brucella sp. NBRC 12953 TaxID=3075481 RepID=UPI0030B5C677